MKRAVLALLLLGCLALAAHASRDELDEDSWEWKHAGKGKGAHLKTKGGAHGKGAAAKSSPPKAHKHGGKELDVCAHPLKRGHGAKAFKRFYFSSTSGQCEAFTYGGRGGNGNNFRSLQTCREKCQPHHHHRTARVRGRPHSQPKPDKHGCAPVVVPMPNKCSAHKWVCAWSHNYCAKRQNVCKQTKKKCVRTRKTCRQWGTTHKVFCAATGNKKTCVRKKYFAQVARLTAPKKKCTYTFKIKYHTKKVFVPGKRHCVKRKTIHFFGPRSTKKCRTMTVHTERVCTKGHFELKRVGHPRAVKHKVHGKRVTKFVWAKKKVWVKKTCQTRKLKKPITKKKCGFVRTRKTANICVTQARSKKVEYRKIPVNVPVRRCTNYRVMKHFKVPKYKTVCTAKKVCLRKGRTTHRHCIRHAKQCLQRRDVCIKWKSTCISQKPYCQKEKRVCGLDARSVAKLAAERLQKAAVASAKQCAAKRTTCRRSSKGANFHKCWHHSCECRRTKELAKKYEDARKRYKAALLEHGGHKHPHHHKNHHHHKKNHHHHKMHPRRSLKTINHHVRHRRI